MTVAPDGRRLSPGGLAQHWDSGVPVVIAIGGTPTVWLRVDEPKGRLTLRTPIAKGLEFPPNTLAHVRTEISIDDGVTYAEISTTDAKLLNDGYAMLMAVADRIQLEGADPVTALRETLVVWHSILRARGRLTFEAEVGLFGELLFLRALLSAGASGAVAWRGGFGEEHDFGLKAADIEVKTTSAEGRRHWIHGLTQLVPTGAMPLFLLSVQITRGGEHQGETLPELIADLRTSIGGADLDAIDSNLAQIGWEGSQSDLFPDRWRLRTVPVALRVEKDFPRLTPDLISGVEVDTSALHRVTYEIDVSGRKPSSSTPPEAAAALHRLREAMNHD